MTLIHINDAVDRSLAIVEGQTIFQNIILDKTYASDLPKIVADESQLQQVFMNIIINAAEAMDGKGKLSLSTSINTDGTQIEIKISDTGHGIKEEDKKRLFEPFFSTKEVGKGTGLGLAISYSIIQKHQGTIEVESQEGMGSAFTIKLPVTRKSKDG
jgi:signal transduction histidine kinase